MPHGSPAGLRTLLVQPNMLPILADTAGCWPIWHYGFVTCFWSATVSWRRARMVVTSKHRQAHCDYAALLANAYILNF